MGLFLPKMDKTMQLVSVHVKVLGMTVPIEFFGIPTPRFMRWWQTQSLRLDGAAIGFDDETAADPYDPAQQQRIIDFLVALSRGLS